MGYGNLDERQTELKMRMLAEGRARRRRNLGFNDNPPEPPVAEKKYSRNHVPKLVTGKPQLLHRKSIIWSREQYRRAQGALVYIFWGQSPKGRIALYIGKSSNGLGRPLTWNHHAGQARDEATEFEFILCDDATDAHNMESRLLLELKPKYNVVLHQRI